MTNARIGVSALAVLLLCGIPCAWSSQEPNANPYEAQSQYLRSFAEFVDWPSSANQVEHPTINFCVLGHDPYGELLDKSILGRRVMDRPAIIIRGQHLEDLGRCDVIFISSSEAKHEDKILKSLRNEGVLTIGDTEDFAARGGVIQFVWERDHVGFLINVDAARRAGLKIHASLLALARIVHDGPPKRGG